MVSSGWWNLWAVGEFGVQVFVREDVGDVTGLSTRFVSNNAAFSDDLEGYANISHQLI